MTRYLPTIAALALAVSARLDAALAWDQREIESRPTLADQRVTCEFHFANGGGKAVTIQSVRPACSCTTAKLDKTTYQPGESGVIIATFTIGERIGEQHKTITVTTDDDEHPVETLTMRVHLPPQPELSPRVLSWKTGEAREPKAIEITVPEGLDFTVDGVSISASHGGTFACELVTVEARRHWRVAVTPPHDGEGSASIAVATSHKTYHAYARVVHPREAEPQPDADAPQAGK